MNSSPQKIVNELKCAARARLILRWATISRHTKYSEHVSKEIDTRVQENLKDLAYIAWGNPAGKMACVSAGAVPVLVRLLSSSKGDEAEHATRTLCNIVAGYDEGKAACVSGGAVPALVSLLSSSKGAEAERAAGALCNIAAGDAACKAACVKACAVPALVSLLSSCEAVFAKKYAQRFLTDIAKHSPEYEQLVINAGFNPV